jgi:hypothetical protein
VLEDRGSRDSSSQRHSCWSTAVMPLAIPATNSRGDGLREMHRVAGEQRPLAVVGPRVPSARLQEYSAL